MDKDQHDEAFVQFRKNLLEQYQIRLNSKTGRRLPINLTAKSTHFGTAADQVQSYFKDKELTIESENIASEIDKILKANDRLLLIGDPGAGKTTILLYAAINFLNTSYSSDDSESSDELQKLPLILNLATWAKGRDFAEWYAQNIADTYSLSQVFVQELLRRNAIVPFFDGFDEVAEQYRDDCFRNMAAYFGDWRERQLIVSSRKKEYAASDADAPVYAEIEVQPLSLAQIKKALSENAQSQAADRALLDGLDRDKCLAEAVETPFYLNTASFLFGKGQRTLADFPFEADSTEGRQVELVEIFVAGQVPVARDRRYLSFLAEKMEQENFLVFELVKMQPGWCCDIRKYRLTYSLAIILIFNVALGPSFIVWIFGFLGSLFISSIRFKIITEDIQIWRWHTFTKNLIQINWNILFSLLLGFALSLVVSLAFNLRSGLSFGIVFGLIFGIVSGLIDAGIKNGFLLHLQVPYQRFMSTLQRSFWKVPAPFIALVLSILAAAYYGGGYTLLGVKDWIQIHGLWLTVFRVGIAFLLIPLLYSRFLEHFSLRLVLYLEGKMPLRVVTFMDSMTDQLIFEDNRRTDKKGKKMRGATWRFRHKILQDYFAGLEAK